MNTKVLSVLEYNKITQKLADYASSAPGKDMCLKLVPLSDLEKIEEAQINTQDAFNRLIKKYKIVKSLLLQQLSDFA